MNFDTIFEIPVFTEIVYKGWGWMFKHSPFLVTVARLLIECDPVDQRFSTFLFRDPLKRHTVTQGGVPNLYMTKTLIVWKKC